MWEVRKQKLYSDDLCPNQLQSQSSPGGLGGATGVEGQRDGKFHDGKFREGKLYCVSVAACMHTNRGTFEYDRWGSLTLPPKII